MAFLQGAREQVCLRGPSLRLLGGDTALVDERDHLRIFRQFEDL